MSIEQIKHTLSVISKSTMKQLHFLVALFVLGLAKCDTTVQETPLRGIYSLMQGSFLPFKHLLEMFNKAVTAFQNDITSYLENFVATISDSYDKVANSFITAYENFVTYINDSLPEKLSDQYLQLAYNSINNCYTHFDRSIVRSSLKDSVQCLIDPVNTTLEDVVFLDKELEKVLGIALNSSGSLTKGSLLRIPSNFSSQEMWVFLKAVVRLSAPPPLTMSTDFASVSICTATNTAWDILSNIIKEFIIFPRCTYQAFFGQLEGQ